MKKWVKILLIVLGGLIVLAGILYGIFSLLASGFDENYEITTDINKYEDVIGENAKDEYADKWGMNEEIFPKSIEGLNVEDFKMVYYDPWDKQFLSYLVVDYEEEAFFDELDRLDLIGKGNWKGVYGATDFLEYTLVAIFPDRYQGMIYALTDEKSKIIYVEIIFCNYYMDIDYEKEIPREYLPIGFDATINNEYRKSIKRD